MQNYKLKTILLLVLFLGIFGLAQNSEAKIINVVNTSGQPSCEQADVQRVINDTGTADGDTVFVPAGSCTWSTKVTIDKGIILKGSNTAITDSTPAGFNSSAIKLTTTNGKTYRVTGFTFYNTTPSSFEGVIHVSGDGQWRIDHITFDNVDTLGIAVGGGSYGVIDHNTFKKTGTNTAFAAILINGGNTNGDTYWGQPYIFGSADAVFIEDNTFDYNRKNDSAIQGHNGVRYVFRHNIVKNTVLDMHGADSSNRSGMIWEIYKNTWTIDVSDYSVPSAISLRGGTGVIWNNTLTATVTNGRFSLKNYRSCYGVGFSGCYLTNCNRCDGDESIDGNEDSTGWPCRDQIGLMGPGQTKSPAYEWGNTKNGSDIDFAVSSGGASCINPAPSDHIQEGRDYYNNTERPAYTPYTYPHPLTLGDDATPPSAPTGVNVQ